MRSRHTSIQMGKVKNVTGRLTASSAGLESVCCGRLSDNMQITGWQRDAYYMRIQLKDTGERMDLKICPYCGERKKRVPRTYRSLQASEKSTTAIKYDMNIRGIKQKGQAVLEDYR